MSLLLTLVGYLALGAAAGTLAGLFGVGGGIIIVPALVLAFGLQDIASEVVVHLAVGTSLATIVVTGASSAYGHWQKGSIYLPWLKVLLPGLVLGAVLGVFVAGGLSATVLGTLFGVFVVLVAIKMLLGIAPKPGSVPPGTLAMGVAGAIIGSVSALFGIGGGTLTVPWLSRCGASMTRAVGTSAACGLPIALTGVLTFIVVGQGNPLLPAAATGFVMWPAFFGVVLASVPFARVGVKLAHVLPAQVMRYAFAALLLVVGVRFIIS